MKCGDITIFKMAAVLNFCSFDSYYGLFLPRHAKQLLPLQVVCPSVRPSVCPSVTLRYRPYRDHIGWNSSKIILRFVSLRCSFFAYPNNTDLFQRKHLEILAGIGVGCWKSGFRRTKALISLKCGKIALRLLLRTDRKSYMRFRFVPNQRPWMILKGHCALCFKTCAPWCCYLFTF